MLVTEQIQTIVEKARHKIANDSVPINFMKNPHRVKVGVLIILHIRSINFYSRRTKLRGDVLYYLRIPSKVCSSHDSSRLVRSYTYLFRDSLL